MGSGSSSGWNVAAMPGLFVLCAPPLSNQRHPSHPHPHPSLQDFYSLTLDSMAESKNERLWFKTNMKLANLWVGLREGAKAAKVGGCGAGLGLGWRGVAWWEAAQVCLIQSGDVAGQADMLRQPSMSFALCICIHACPLPPPTCPSLCHRHRHRRCPAGPARAAPVVPDGGGAGRPEEGHAAAGDLCAGDPDAHRGQEQQEAQGAVPGGG